MQCNAMIQNGFRTMNAISEFRHDIDIEINAWLASCSFTHLFSILNTTGSSDTKPT